MAIPRLIDWFGSAMRSPHTNILLLTIIFVIVGLVGQAWLFQESSSRTWPGFDRETLLSPRGDFERTFAGGANLWGKPTNISARVARFPAVTPPRVADETSVLVSEMCALQLMAQGTELSLNSDQWTAFATVMLRLQAVRYAYEAQIAKLREIAPGRYRAEIPMYAQAGDELREQFSGELRAALGETTACDVMARLDDRLERRFAGFGVSVQTLDIIASVTGDPSNIQFTRTVCYWNSVEGSERLTTRREIHFPVLEDPTGESWSALLAKLGATSVENRPG